jgi:hypothetical protein
MRTVAWTEPGVNARRLNISERLPTVISAPRAPEALAQRLIQQYRSGYTAHRMNTCQNWR